MTRSTGVNKRKPKTRRINLRVDEELGEFVIRWCEDNGKTVTCIVEDLFRRIRASADPNFEHVE